MAEAEEAPEIFADRHFQQLARRKTSLDEFKQLVAERVMGYSQKKKLAAGLKEMLSRVQVAEEKLYLVRNLGKAKSKLEPGEQAIADNHESPDLKEKIQFLNTDMQAMLDEGRLTAEEKPVVHEQLLARRAAAKADGKAKLLEKLERNIAGVAKAKLPIELPVPNVEKVYPVHLELLEIERLEKKAQKSLLAHEKTALGKKAGAEASMRAWALENRLWFETEFEFRPRMLRALDVVYKQKAEERKREEEEAVERQRRLEEEALEQKRLAQQEAEERKARELEEKLQAKRLEAAARPQKAVPQPKKKEKVKRLLLDNKELFQPPPRNDDEEGEGEEKAPQADSEEGTEETPETVQEPPAPAPAAATPAAEEKKVAKPKEEAPKAKPKASTASIWKEAAAPASAATDNAENEEADPNVEPSLADAAAAKPKAAAKAKIPPPAKKDKKKFAKVDPRTLGWDANNPNVN